jgi:alkylation response protein AidB-like acyl-CoA dehydrogenase
MTYNSLNEEQLMIMELASDFSKNEILPEAQGHDRTSKFPVKIIHKLAELGFLGHYIPQEYGGSGLDFLSYIIAIEKISAACASTGTIVMAHNSLACSPINEFGNEEQKIKYLPDLATGKKIGCFALSEPESGSDAASINTTAVKNGKEYILNGTKSWVTNGAEADVAIVFTTTEKSKKSRGITTFIVDLNTPGISVGKSEKKLGIKATSTTQFIFEDARVPESSLLAKEGEGFKIAMKTLDKGRIAVASQAVGISQAALDASVEYSRERKTFGSPIIEHQGIQFMIAEMATKVEAARLLTWQAAGLRDKNLKFTKQSAMAKLFAAETAMWVTTKAIQIHGGNGYTTDYPVERYFRDAKITEIYEGTSEIQKIVIAKQTLNEYL